MKSFAKEIWTAILMGLIIPNLILNGAAYFLTEESEEKKEAIKSNLQEETYLNLLQSDGGRKVVELETYITGVVLGEMPASFEPESLKAQAVAARTYTSKVMKDGYKHGENTLCLDSKCCQAYIRKESYLEQNGGIENYEKVSDSVQKTAGQVLVYEGQLIESTYFACSGGITEDAKAVWGTEYPYLQTVVSPGEEAAEHFSDVYYFSKTAFQDKTGCTLEGDPEEWFQPVSYTSGGGVELMKIGGEEYTGIQLRQMLNLPSTAMEMSYDGDEIKIITKGFGHRVGMSQYGANAMAASGSTYDEILEYYYPGTLIENRNELLQLHYKSDTIK